MSNGRKLIGLDVGDARIGVAISDDTGFLATPAEAIRRESPKADVEAVLNVATEANADAIIVGLPVSLDGSLGPQARKVQGFHRLLAQATNIRTETWDERFSTVEAERRLREQGIEPSRNRPLLDSTAAAIILQSYLDADRESPD